MVQQGSQRGSGILLFRFSPFKNNEHHHSPRHPSGTVDVGSFELSGQPFIAISAGPLFKFKEAISFIVYCESQEEIDDYWERLGEGGDPEAQQCGWIKDKFGLSWQVVPVEMDKMMREGTPEQIARVIQAFLKMKKFDLAQLRKALKEYESVATLISGAPMLIVRFLILAPSQSGKCQPA